MPDNPVKSKEEQVKLFQEGIANISRGEPADEKIRLVATVMWHLTQLFMSLPKEELEKITPLRLALGMKYQLPFPIIIDPANMGKIEMTKPVAELFLDLFAHKVTSHTARYGDDPDKVEMGHFALIGFLGDEERLTQWCFRSANNRELARFAELLATGKVSLPPGHKEGSIVGSENHILVSAGKPIQMVQNEGERIFTEDAQLEHVFQLVRVREVSI